MFLASIARYLASKTITHVPSSHLHVISEDGTRKRERERENVLLSRVFADLHKLECGTSLQKNIKTVYSSSLFSHKRIF